MSLTLIIGSSDRGGRGKRAKNKTYMSRIRQPIIEVTIIPGGERDTWSKQRNEAECYAVRSLAN